MFPGESPWAAHVSFEVSSYAYPSKQPRHRKEQQAHRRHGGLLGFVLWTVDEGFRSRVSLSQGQGGHLRFQKTLTMPEHPLKPQNTTLKPTLTRELPKKWESKQKWIWFSSATQQQPFFLIRSTPKKKKKKKKNSQQPQPKQHHLKPPNFVQGTSSSVLQEIFDICHARQGALQRSWEALGVHPRGQEKHRRPILEFSTLTNPQGLKPSKKMQTGGQTVWFRAAAASLTVLAALGPLL